MFSIIIPTYNRNEQLLVALETLKDQTNYDFEVIIIDDASEFSYKVDIDAYPFDITYHRVLINAGPSAARNFGVSLANFEWILFLDDDDYFLPNKIEKLKNTLLKNDVDFVYHRARILMVNEKVKYTTSQLDINKIEGTISKLIYRGNFIGGPPNFAIRKATFDSLGGFSENIRAIEDYEFLIRLTNKIDSSRIMFLDEVLTSCLYTTKATSVSKNIENIKRACNYITDVHIDSKSKKNDFDVNSLVMVAHAMLMNLTRKSSGYYFLAGVKGRKIKYIVMSLICFCSPALLIKIRCYGDGRDDSKG